MTARRREPKRAAEATSFVTSAPLFLAVIATLIGGCRAPGSGSGASPTASASAGAAAAPPLDTSWERDSSHLLETGERAPDFEGIAHTGMRVRLSLFLEKPVVIYFYPRDAAPGAVTEATSFRDAWLRINQRVGMVLGVAPDDRIAHRDFATAHELPFLLVGDEKGKIARAFGVPLEGGVPRHATFIVARDGRIARTFASVNPEGHAAEVVAALEALGGS